MRYLIAPWGAQCQDCDRDAPMGRAAVVKREATLDSVGVQEGERYSVRNEVLVGDGRYKGSATGPWPSEPPLCPHPRPRAGGGQLGTRAGQWLWQWQCEKDVAGAHCRLIC